MTWRYEVKWYPGGNNNITNVVTVESRPRDSGLGLVAVEAWIDQDQPVAGNRLRLERPLKVFARVTKGDAPVMMARVNLDVTVNSADGSVVTVDNIQLLDNGNGGKCNF